MHNFAPPSLRRRIGILGFLHKRVFGACHPELVQELAFDANQAGKFHASTLVARASEVSARRKLYNSSLYMYILMYNRLPQEVINLPSVSRFQSQLTKFAKTRAEQGDETWRSSYKNCKDAFDFFYG